MCTIEMIENLKIENSTKIWVCAISPYHQRYDIVQALKTKSRNTNGERDHTQSGMTSSSISEKSEAVFLSD